MEPFEVKVDEQGNEYYTINEIVVPEVDGKNARLTAQLDELCPLFELQVMSSVIFSTPDKWWDIYYQNKLKHPSDWTLAKRYQAAKITLFGFGNSFAAQAVNFYLNGVKLFTNNIALPGPSSPEFLLDEIRDRFLQANFNNTEYASILAPSALYTLETGEPALDLSLRFKYDALVGDGLTLEMLTPSLDDYFGDQIRTVDDKRDFSGGVIGKDADALFLPKLSNLQASKRVGLTRTYE